MRLIDTHSAFCTLKVAAYCAIVSTYAGFNSLYATETSDFLAPTPDVARSPVEAIQTTEAAEVAESVELFDLSAALKRKQSQSKIASAIGDTQADGLPRDADALESEFVPLAEIVVHEIVPVRGNLYSPGVELIPLDIGSDDASSADDISADGSLPWELPALDDLPAMERLEDPTFAQTPASDRIDLSASNQQKVPFVFPKREECETPLGKPLASLTGDTLFQPLSRIKLSGTSTAPPLTSEPDSVLELPEDGSCDYATNAYPAVYATEPQFAMSSPYRSPYPFRHHPLYYEDPNLERCGQSWSYLTNAKSACLFASQIAAWPVHAVILPMRSHVAALPSPPSYHRFGVGVYSPFLRKHSDKVTNIKATRKIKK